MEFIEFGYEAIKDSPYFAMSSIPPVFFHHTPFYKITFIESGSTKVEFNTLNGNASFVKDCEVGDAFIVTPNDIHRYDVDVVGEYSHRDIYATPETMKTCCDIISDDLFDEINNGDTRFFKISSYDILSFNKTLSVFINNEQSDRLDGIHKSVLVSLLGMYCLLRSKKRVYPDWIEEMLVSLEKLEVIKQPISQIVKGSNYSHSYSCRVFKRYFGMTLAQYVENRRLELSRAMLVNTDKTIEEIADDLGIGTVSNFIKAFSKKYRVPPGKYRKNSREEQTRISFVEGNNSLNDVKE